MENTQGSFTIRKAEVEDAEAIALVGWKAWRWAYASFLPAEFIEQRCNLERRIERTREFLLRPDLSLVAVNATGRVIGFANEHVVPDIEGFDAEIGGLYVEPEANRSGVGRALVSEMVDHFMATGRNSMAIHTLAQNEIGCRFYARIGGRRHRESVWFGYPGVWWVWNDLSEFH